MLLCMCLDEMCVCFFFEFFWTTTLLTCANNGMCFVCVVVVVVVPVVQSEVRAHGYGGVGGRFVCWLIS